jgi:uncharacterized protein (TIGR02271 family)
MPRRIEDRKVIPVIREEAFISKREVETGRVLISKEVREREEELEVPLSREDVHVERVPIDRPIEERPAPRYEGDTLVLPVVEERIVLVKQLVLKEEVRVTRTVTTVSEPRRVTLREDDVRIDRVPAHDGGQVTNSEKAGVDSPNRK